MTTDEARAGETRSSPAPEEGRRDRLAIASANVPFRVKVGAVWIAIAGILVFFFWAAEFDNRWVLEHFRLIAAGLIFTIGMAIGGILLAILLALLGALGRLSRNPLAYGLSGFYTSFFRGTPLIVQLFLLYAALPILGDNLVEKFSWVPGSLDDLLTRSALFIGIMVLGLNYGAYMTEIFRAGIQSVSHGQSEAADALGMSYRQKMRRVVLPQALRVIIPPTGNEFIAMMKDTALVSFLGTTIQTAEIFRRGQLYGAGDVRPLEGYITVAALYWMLTAIFTFFQSRLERRLSRGYVRAAPAGRGERDRRKVIVTGAPGTQGAPSGYVLDPSDAPVAGHSHVGGTAPTEIAPPEAPKPVRGGDQA
ncbi:MAG TPA: amino acid ABC transporter permease [Actinomycetota bacterium]|nr:amino acid ABC transporter permease [Actinomycetota bacterium]